MNMNTVFDLSALVSDMNAVSRSARKADFRSRVAFAGIAVLFYIGWRRVLDLNAKIDELQREIDILREDD